MQSITYEVRVTDSVQDQVERAIPCWSMTEAGRVKTFLLRQMILETESEREGTPLPSSEDIESIMYDKYQKSVVIVEVERAMESPTFSDILKP